MAIVTLTNVPKEVLKILLTEQLRLKELKGTNQFGLERTVYKIVKEWKRCCRDVEKNT